MEFSKIAEQNTYDRVFELTDSIRKGNVPNPAILNFFQDNDIDIQCSVFPCLGELDTNLYSGTLISQDRKVYEFVIDAEVLNESDLDDVTQQLGPKDPEHPDADIKDSITMSLLYFDEQAKIAA